MKDNQQCKDTNFLELPYSERQLIVITSDELATATNEEKLSALKREKSGVNWGRIAEAAVGAVVPFGNLAAEVVREGLRAWARAKEVGLRVYLVSQSNAEKITFPPGHPRDGVLYVGHPTQAGVYYTMSEFHRVTFQHKFAEAVDMLMSLGAVELQVEHLAGWSKEFSASMEVGLPSADVSTKAHAGSKKAAADSLLFKAQLSGSDAPKLPKNLVWYPHEPTWQSIAKGRLKYGLQDFSLQVNYQDDFGINVGLKVQANKVGLDLGGKFEDHQSTVWRIQGKFKA